MQTNNNSQKRIISGVEVELDEGTNLNYEKTGLIGKILGSIVAFILSVMPRKLGYFLVNKSGQRVRSVKDKATTYYALEQLYTNDKLSFENGILSGLINYFWFKLGNPRAVRNRLKLVKEFLKQVVPARFNVDHDLKTRFCILSLGCGSARAVIESLSELKNSGLDLSDAEVKLLDKAPEALEISREIIKEHSLKECNFSFIESKIRYFDQYLNGLEPDVIEMVGVLDYLTDEKAIEMFVKIRKYLKEGGYFLTANIMPNKEMNFVTRIVNWHMIYRHPDDLINILLAAGFKKDKIKIKVEPLRTHMVALCRK